MYMTAGYLGGVLSGRSWEELVRERIFVPLGMKQALFSQREMRATADYVLPYKKDTDQKQTILIPFDEISDDGMQDDPVGPAGSIICSLRDMSRWLLLHLNGGKFGEARIVSEGQMQQMHSPQMVFPAFLGKYQEMPHMNYGMGWFVQPYRGHNVVHHGGNLEGYTTLVTFAPQDGIGVVVLINMNGSPLREIISYNIYDRLFGLTQVSWTERFRKLYDEMEAGIEKGKEKSETDRALNAGPSHPLEAYTGEFEHPGYGVLSIELENDELKAIFNNRSFAVKHYHYDIFEFHSDHFDLPLKATFSTNVRGDINRVSAPFEPAVQDIIFTRMPAKELTERRFLEQFIGAYELLDTVITVSLKGETALQVALPGQPEVELVAYQGAEFRAKELSGVSIEFMRDDAGVVREAVLSAGGVFTAKKV